MKKNTIGLLITVTLSLFKPALSMAQSHEAQQLLLNFEKLTQLKNILSDMKKGYEVISNGYNAVKDISKGSFSLHQVFIDGLIAVNPQIEKYQRVSDIVDYQKRIVQEYKRAYQQFKRSGNFNRQEVEYLGKVYRKLFNQSVENLNRLAIILTANKLQMSDDERLAAIDRIFEDTQDKLEFVRQFNKEARLLSILRQKERKDAGILSDLYELNQ